MLGCVSAPGAGEGRGWQWRWGAHGAPRAPRLGGYFARGGWDLRPRAGALSTGHVVLDGSSLLRACLGQGQIPLTGLSPAARGVPSASGPPRSLSSLPFPGSPRRRMVHGVAAVGAALGSSSVSPSSLLPPCFSSCLLAPSPLLPPLLHLLLFLCWERTGSSPHAWAECWEA